MKNFDIFHTDLNSILNSGDNTREQLELCDKNVEKVGKNLEKQKEQIQIWKQRLEKLKKIANEYNCFNEEGKEEDIAYETLLKKQEKMRKEFEGMQNRVKVDDRDQDLLIMNLEEQIANAQEKCEGKSKFIYNLLY